LALMVFIAACNNDDSERKAVAAGSDTKPAATEKTASAAASQAGSDAAKPATAPAASAPAGSHAAVGDKPATPAAAVVAQNDQPAAAAPAAGGAEGGKVITTPSGLKYEVLKEGTGAKPTATSNVTVHYRGTLTDGKEFDSSYKRGQPATFPLNRVIKGWTEGVQLMTEGSKYKFTIPPELGYGAAGAGGSIPPNATLIFEVELIKVN